MCKYLVQNNFSQFTVRITRIMNFHNNASQILKVRPLNITLPQKQKTLKKLLILKVTFS